MIQGRIPEGTVVIIVSTGVDKNNHLGVSGILVNQYFYVDIDGNQCCGNILDMTDSGGDLFLAYGCVVPYDSVVGKIAQVMAP